LWNQYIHRYHYLGFKTLPGAQLRYWVTPVIAWSPYWALALPLGSAPHVTNSLAGRINNAKKIYTLSLTMPVS
jgi:hypothetical protein